MFFQNRMGDGALHPHTPAVDDPNFAKPLALGLIEILLDHDRDLSRLKGMQIDGILDRDVVRSFVHGPSIMTRRWR